MAQMIDVLRGHMSIVGPRPPVPYEYQMYTDEDMDRLTVLPGITGLAQVRARSKCSFAEMVAFGVRAGRRGLAAVRVRSATPATNNPTVYREGFIARSGETGP